MKVVGPGGVNYRERAMRISERNIELRIKELGKK